MISVKEAQKKWLFECLNQNKNTLYGEKYNFKNITSLKEYQQNLPIISYEDIENLIKKISLGESDILFKGKAIAFEKTGGSSGGEKLIPYSNQSFIDFQKAIIPWFKEIQKEYNLKSHFYFSISPALKQKSFTKGGIEIGVSDERYLGEGLKDVAASFITPSWISFISDLKEWEIATLYFLIVSEKLEFISIWSPTFLLMLLEVAQKRADEILDILKNGNQKLPKNEKAYQRFKLYLQNKNTKTLWQNLKLISCWADSSSERFFNQLKSKFPDISFEPKGLLSTEAIVTIPYINFHLLTINSGFYEFLDSNLKAHFAFELKKNQKYEVIITTNGGLYRYKSGDMVKCEGHIKSIPILKFLGRVGIVSDLVGEKLTEEFVSNAIKDIEGFCMLVLINQNYTLIIDDKNHQNEKEIIAIVEKNLSKNPQYLYARKINQLKALKIKKVKNPLQKYIDYKIKKGSKIGDIKIPALNLDGSFLGT